MQTDKTSDTARQDGMGRHVPVMLLALAVAVSYFNAIGNGFIYDDLALVMKNPQVKDWRYLPEIFTSGYWTTTFGASGGLYRPLTTISFLVDHTFGGSPMPFHVDNILIHFVCTLLVYLVLKAILGRERPALFAAIVFAVHPVHTEAVAWISGRAEILSVTLLMASLWVFIARPPRPLYVSASVALFFLALLAKETAAVLPVLLAVYMSLYQPATGSRENGLRLFRRLWPHAAAFAVYFLIRAIVLSDSLLPPPHTIPLLQVGPYERLLTMFTAYFHYARLALFPTGLTVFYYFFTESALHFTVLAFLAAAVLLAVFGRKLVAGDRDAAFGVSLFLIALFPVSNIIPTGIIMSERAMYLPSVGVCLILGLAFARAANSQAAALRRGAFAIFGLLVIAFVSLALLRNPYWRSEDDFVKSNMEFYERAVKVRPDIALNWSNLADIRVFLGKYDDETMGYIEQALRLDPDDYLAHFAKAAVLERQGRLEESLREYEACLATTPSFKIYNDAGALLQKMGRYEESRKSLEQAIELNPYCDICYLNLGIGLAAQGDEDGAYRNYGAAIRLNPRNAGAHFRLGVLLGARNELDRAIEELRAVTRLAPDFADAYYYLAVAYGCRGDIGAASAEVYRALELKPDYPEARELKERLGHGR